MSLKFEDIFDVESYENDANQAAGEDDAPASNLSCATDDDQLDSATGDNQANSLGEETAGLPDLYDAGEGCPTPDAPAIVGPASFDETAQPGASTAPATNATDDTTSTPPLDAGSTISPHIPDGYGQAGGQGCADVTDAQDPLYPYGAGQQQLYAPPPYPPPPHTYDLPADYPLPTGPFPMDFLNGGAAHAQPQWQPRNAWEGNAPMGPTYGNFYTGNAAMPSPWDAQPIYAAPAPYQQSFQLPQQFIPPGPVRSRFPAPLRRGPNGATSSNARHAPYSIARGAPAQRGAGLVRHQQRAAPAPTLTWHDPVVAPHNGQAMPRQSQMQWHHTNAENYQDVFSQSPASLSANQMLGPSVQAFGNSLISRQQSQHTPGEGNAAPVPSGSSLPVTAPAALKPPTFDYSNGQLHRCPVCVANPKATTSQKGPFTEEAMQRHYRRIHDGYRELHGPYAHCIFCDKRLAVSRRGHFRDHWRQNRKPGCGQLPCKEVRRLGGERAYAAMRQHLRSMGIPLDHWQMAEDAKLMNALLALPEDDEDEDRDSMDNE
ncbi:hypothetical protein AURDEDRAFT_170773 [Auricularia subglabra TFB-10046 SS5]|uniref:Uncharacterized protein n=1 Tax=Auricularia subglabra (strain TFB-10046 / SS5) TaxID=717982 RepID=J0D235_AURST|nr:hypothetical protein AURDEDRAFT_170773 [Auricularia subglabra TFB-10046 SS5]